MKAVLVGDSIFDNAPYVEQGDAVSDIFQREIVDTALALIAVDGDMTTDVAAQLKKFPKEATHVFVSCGGNDALQAAHILGQSVSNVGEALDYLCEIKQRFRSNYQTMLQQILAKHSNVCVCTVYNQVPGMPESALTALALFNEVILQEAFSLKLPVIDLRLVFNDIRDYSPVSPIEPSVYGGEKLVSVIHQVLKAHDFACDHSVVYS